MPQVQTPIPMYTRNDATMADTLGKLYKLMWMPPPNSKVKQKKHERAIDDYIRRLLAAPERMLPSC